MQYNRLGSSSVEVSEICLGTMTWGIQNTQQDADQQMAMALDAGINFIDTAEMYPVPPNQQTYGDTERILGDWLSRNAQHRDDLVIMTKIAGPGLSYIREGSAISASTVTEALDDSLARLQQDYIDVYQLHWPNRISPHFGKHWPNQTNPNRIDSGKERDNMRAIVASLGNAIDAGKIKYWGLSDDTPWGIQTYLQLCDELGVPRPVSIQNEFSLIHAKDWPYVIETCVFEDIAYLPWSPLAGGMLSGKYIDGARPEGSRYTLVQRQGLFRDTAIANTAVQAYVELATEFGMTPSQLALAWCKQTHGVTSTIIGATNAAQLQENIQAFSITLDNAQLKRIQNVLQQFPTPF
jgi:aryl-alcohol dehydrogenase-like predicted oxidoreductase